MGKTFSRISFHLCAIFGIGGTQEQDAGTRKKYEQQDIELQIELNPREMHVKLQFSPISLGNFLGWCQVCNFLGGGEIWNSGKSTYWNVFDQACLITKCNTPGIGCGCESKSEME